MMEDREQKMRKLREYLAGLGSVAVAFSGGVDSTFLLQAAKDVLGDGVIALTAVSDFFPDRERREADGFCRERGIRQIVCREEILKVPGVAANPANRCYLCKRALFEMFLAEAKRQGFSHVAEGSNLEDLGDYRPGLQAIAELKILSPLRECGFTKQDIRALSGEMGLPTASKPSYACLASRFVYGEEITGEKLAMVDKAEQLLLDLGFTQMRVRIHGTLARIELLPEEMVRLLEPGIREEIAGKFRSFGFAYVALDLQGYRTGSMNETLTTDGAKEEKSHPLFRVR